MGISVCGGLQRLRKVVEQEERARVLNVRDKPAAHQADLLVGLMLEPDETLQRLQEIECAATITRADVRDDLEWI